MSDILRKLWKQSYLLNKILCDNDRKFIIVEFGPLRKLKNPLAPLIWSTKKSAIVMFPHGCIWSMNTSRNLLSAINAALRERLLPWRVKSNGLQDKDFFQAAAWPHSHSQRENQIKSILYKDTDGLVLHSKWDVYSCELWGLSGAKLSKTPF